MRVDLLAHGMNEHILRGVLMLVCSGMKLEWSVE
jgi:hypothetical protein